MRLWVETEATRLTATGCGSNSPPARPGRRALRRSTHSPPLNQAVTSFELELLGADGLVYDDWSTDRGRRNARRSSTSSAAAPGYRYLRAKGNSIEGGTSEILRNIISERVLGLPSETRVDKDVAWKDLPKCDLRILRLAATCEEALRARRAVILLAKRAPWPDVLKRTETDEKYDPALWTSLARELGVAGLPVAESDGGAGATWRESAVVAEELGRSVAGTPFLGSAVLATAAALRLGDHALLHELATGERTAAVAVPVRELSGRRVPRRGPP